MPADHVGIDESIWQETKEHLRIRREEAAKVDQRPIILWRWWTLAKLLVRVRIGRLQIACVVKIESAGWQLLDTADGSAS
jgi:hypothetical protein